jgi:dienelactone hydrolase
VATETFESHGKKLAWEVFRPSGTAKYPAIVLAYGTDGMNEPFGKDIRSFATDVAGKGYVVLLPHYFDRTDTPAGLAAVKTFTQNRDLWTETLGDALSAAIDRSDVKADRAGLLGFSMGGHLALRTAIAGTGAKPAAVVEFFAPVDMVPFSDLGGSVASLPPTQIHHGEADHIVPSQQSRDLETMLIGAGKHKGQDYEIFFYPGEDHGFRGISAIAMSKQRTVEFFDRYLRS